MSDIEFETIRAEAVPADELAEKVAEEETEQDEKKEEKMVLPGLPDCLFELTPEQQKYYEYTGDPNDIHQRMRHKLWLIWQFWYRFRNNEKTIELVQKVNKEDGDAFHIANELVNMIDMVGRVLKATDITHELFGGND